MRALRGRLAAVIAVLALIGFLSGCDSKADVASRNLSTAADNFEIMRQIVFYNGITGKYIAEVEGRCSIGNDNTSKQFSVTCKVGPDKYIKNYLGLSDNVTWFALQTSPAAVSVYRYRIIWRPTTIVPDPEFDFGQSEDQGGDQ